jgi:hypothetical protein
MRKNSFQTFKLIIPLLLLEYFQNNLNHSTPVIFKKNLHEEI